MKSSLYLSLTLSLNCPCGTSGKALLNRRSFGQRSHLSLVQEIYMYPNCIEWRRRLQSLQEQTTHNLTTQSLEFPLAYDALVTIAFD